MTDIEDLARRAARGDRDAFHDLVEATRTSLFQLAWRILRNYHDAEDVLQEVYIKAHRGLPDWRGHAKVQTWLYRIAVNACLDRTRGTKATTISIDNEEERHWEPADPHPANDPQRGLDARELREQVDVALMGLTPTERAIFNLRHERELALKEIAAVLDRSEGMVKNLLFRGMHKLRARLAHLREEPQRRIS